MILCCGEALIDMLPRELETGQGVFLPVSGGAIFNTAVALGRLGEPAGLVGGISVDLFGKQLIDSLAQSKVNTDFCVRVENPTTLAFVKLSNGNAEYTFMDENSATRSLTPQTLPEFPSDVSALHFGAISLIPEPCGSAYEALMEREAEKRVISLDPNIRVSFIPDADKHRKRILHMLALSDIVKVSDEDLVWIYPDTPLEDAVQKILALGVPIVLLTKGADGVTAFTQNAQFDVASEKAVVVDTVGAGDTFNAGFLSGLKKVGCLNKKALKSIDVQNLTSAIKLANKVAAVTVSRAGANPPWAHELV